MNRYAEAAFEPWYKNLKWINILLPPLQISNALFYDEYHLDEFHCEIYIQEFCVHSICPTAWCNGTDIQNNRTKQASLISEQHQLCCSRPTQFHIILIQFHLKLKWQFLLVALSAMVIWDSN